MTWPAKTRRLRSGEGAAERLGGTGDRGANLDAGGVEAVDEEFVFHELRGDDVEVEPPAEGKFALLFGKTGPLEGEAAGAIPSQRREAGEDAVASRRGGCKCGG